MKSGCSGIGLGGAPGVQFDGGDLCHGDQAVQVVDRQVGRTLRLAGADAVGQGAVAVLLEEVFARDAFRAAHDRERAVDQAGQRVIGHRLPVFREVLLGDAGPQLAIGMGDGHALDAGGARLGLAGGDDGGAGPGRGGVLRALLWRHRDLGAALRRHRDDRAAGWTGRLLRAHGLVFRSGIGHVAHHLIRRLVLAQAEIHRVAHAGPLPDQDTNWISTTRSGRTQWIAASIGSPATSSPCGGSAASASSLSRRVASSSSEKPVPTPPA